MQRSGEELELRHHVLPGMHGFIQIQNIVQARLRMFHAAVLRDNSQIAQQMPLLPTQEEPVSGHEQKK